MQDKSVDNKSQNFRLVSLDITRGIAIFFMITYHFFTWWINIELDYDLMVVFQIWGHLSAPLFLMILGISQVFSFHSRKLRGFSEKESRNYIIKRLIWFFLISIVMNIFLEFNHLITNFFTIFAWHIFQILLFTTLILYIIRKLPIYAKIIFMKSIYILNLIIRPLLNVPFLGMPYILEFNSIQNVMGGLLFNGLFSPLPFLIYGILGSIIGDLYLKIKENNSDLDKFWKYILFFGVITAVAACLIRPYLYTDYLGTRFIWFVRESYSATIFNMGLSLLIFFAIYFLIEVKNKNNIVFRQLKLFGKQPLTIFVFHYILGAFIFALFPIPLIRSMNLIQYAIMTAIFFISWNILLIYWYKKKFQYSLDWLIKTYS